ncbi:MULTISPECIES: TIGR01620 family protein [unclassified Mesorhizobium]|uniref:YcjF family protein n=5 Tax=Mesorhizobium TaxID=68287 RepID=UPI000FD57FAF|nr:MULTISPECIES: TIGR01620 family protein [unclassified Mesorhizobium]RUV12072.1 TIGR01620 family protein [Mesorhizobium sp. M5C.F.Ca.IN.020.32.2.1]RWC41583.1 MAG: TIGR01620 family protein [Mesorhizobium sp.]RWH57694.1 MAG: TIGR01620 family protein [Mesorhizobium sp.]RWI69876.1 MAG: TIGR01620 family protein [Mesorhizobium sp.]RWI77008.1 MAG: TIGR01620 family protein [Mesorhizobium sp.]
MTAPRKPAAFRIEPEALPKERAALRQPDAPSARKPRTVKADLAVVTPAEIDVFDEPDIIAAEPPPATAPRKRSMLGGLLFGALGVLVSLALGLWTDQLIRDLFARAEWLGWLAAGMAVIALLALLIILVREFLAITRLAEVEKLQKRALDAIARDDPKAARAVVDELSAFVAAKPETAAGRRALADLRDEIIDGGDLVRLAETEILGPLDARAKVMILEAAKRVSLVTAVSPRALVDVAYVVFEAGRLIRRLSELYGGRPGTLGFFRLARSVLAHLAVTGSIAVGDSFVQQIVGHGLAARLSAKLGEGVVNGMMTARIGIAAMETARPLPFSAARRPGMGDFLSALTSFATKKQKETSASDT